MINRNITEAVTEALSILPAKMDSTEARVMLYAIGLQESRFKHRRQLVGNPPRPTGLAKSYWQAEQSGGMVRGLLNYYNDNVRDLAVGLCVTRGVSPDEQSVWDAIESDDVLAAGLARLLLWTDPHPLPEVTDIDGAWDLYQRTWKAGKPHRHTWDDMYAIAVKEALA